MSGEQGTCPLGGEWYTCIDQSPTFFECCTSDPSNGSGCSPNDLIPAGMGTGTGPGSSFWPNVQCNRGQWWTCAEQTPTFQGCCGSNPYDGTGCPLSKLYPTAFWTIPASFSPSTTSSLLPATSTGPQLSTSSPSLSSQSSDSNVPAIAGGVVGGALLFILFVIIIYYRLRRLRQRKITADVSNTELTDPDNSQSAPQGPPMKHISHDSFPAGRSPLTPGTPAPAYGSEAYEPSVSVISESGGGHGLGLVNLETLQEVDAQGDTPNPYPAQRVWSASMRSELYGS